MTESLTPDYITIDAIGKPCPLPLLLLKKQLKKLPTPQNILLKASDPHSEIDILRYCELHQLICQFTQISDHELHFLIKS
ncbi:sulfurtransferase TusA family protein [Acinetobacter sichuanensis]|uniref:Sulfurtransferase TusA family protein n=1 Tax=Acinetobacter sichuanensis TaxID=2136183 RepID=A0A371YSM8_9GAMM|nr:MULTISPECIES: sulfurtransferase TusA family protein [Acinetobacter]MDM1247410.1 sulfurtransferase TusA family protein [Acinetobacter sp. R933-2]MDM1763176.1 sulfurtransferase TusA family protein [Acinetobacter sp. 226-1]MDM1766655.1 sulfurtransferase TusA family protein [Acinetobacter sp. 226-4]MDQ9020196.1 sulfurtransferase TusA family protein [Acinetobacter sichuanensis]RFC84455.1 sulfurtransferase TusA family protein [Acinetobacter sichuanensis]